jgi:hypothetical protein
MKSASLKNNSTASTMQTRSPDEQTDILSPPHAGQPHKQEVNCNGIKWIF